MMLSRKGCAKTHPWLAVLSYCCGYHEKSKEACGTFRKEKTLQLLPVHREKTFRMKKGCDRRQSKKEHAAIGTSFCLLCVRDEAPKLATVRNDGVRRRTTYCTVRTYRVPCTSTSTDQVDPEVKKSYAFTHVFISSTHVEFYVVLELPNLSGFQKLPGFQDVRNTAISRRIQRIILQIIYRSLAIDKIFHSSH